MQAYAREKNVSIEKATTDLQTMRQLSASADARRSDPSYSGFRVVETPSGLEGQLALTSQDSPAFDAERSLRLVPSPIPEREHSDVAAKLTNIAKQRGVPDASTVTIDPFSGHVTIWRRPPVQDNRTTAHQSASPELRRDLSQVDPRLPSDLSASIELEPTSRQVEGGRPAYRNQSFLWYFNTTISQCTTGFGVADYAYGDSGYLTAGHCSGYSGWQINGYNVNWYVFRSVGGYQDRVYMVAGGAVWWVYNGSFYEDMASYPTHIYQGVYYCSYSRLGSGLQCGTISQVNVPVTGPNGTVYTSKGGSSQWCVPGDSGGPVWQPGWYESAPAGLVDATIPDEGYRCLFVALDDQLAGTSLSLL